jgi:putative sterol carrier protein
MAVLYPSDEWIKELDRICNEDPEFKEAAGSFAGKFIFQIEKEEGKLHETALLSVKVENGVSSEARALASLEDCPDADYIITGKYSAWKNIVQAKLEPLRAIMTRKLKLIKGSQLKILKEVKLTLRIMNNCTEVDAVYADEQ